MLMAVGLQGAAVIATDAAISVIIGIVKIGVFGAFGAVTPKVIAVALLTVDDANWNVAELVVLATLTIISGLTSVQVGGSSRIRISGEALGLMLAVGLLGGAPACLLAAATILVGWLKTREKVHYLCNNLVVYTALMLAGGLCFRAATGWSGSSERRCR